MAPNAQQQKSGLGSRSEEAGVSGDGDFVSLAPGKAAASAPDQTSKIKGGTKPQKPAGVDNQSDGEDDGYIEAYKKTRTEMRRLLAGDGGARKDASGNGKGKVKETHGILDIAAGKAKGEQEEVSHPKKPKRVREAEGVEEATLVQPKKAKKASKPVGFDEEDGEDEEEIVARPKRVREAEGMEGAKPVQSKKAKKASKAVVFDKDDEGEEEEETVPKPQKAKKGAATKVTRAPREEPVTLDLPFSGTSDVGLSPPTTTAPAGRMPKLTAAGSGSRTGSPTPRARPSTISMTQRQPSKNPAPTRPGPPADRFKLSTKKSSNLKTKNVHDVRNAPELPAMNRPGRTANTFEASTSKGLGTVMSQGTSTDGNRARMAQGTLPNMAGLGDPQELMRRVQGFSDRNNGLNGMAQPPAKKGKR